MTKTISQLNPAPSQLALPTVSRDAVLSPCGRYRYMLTRRWGEGAVVCWIMLNPSVADAVVSDPTLARCVAFSKAWGAGGLVLVNLFALRATDPRELRVVADPVGPENDRWIREALALATPFAVVAWGSHGRFMARDLEVLAIIREMGRMPYCLGKTRGGRPRHPLYLRRDTKLEPYL